MNASWHQRTGDNLGDHGGPIADDAARLYRYELPVKSFESLDDAGMWVAREAVTPLAMEELSDLPGALSACGVDLRVVESLTPLRGVWETTLHASGIRLRNAVGW